MVARRKPRRKVRNPTRYARETGTRLPRWREKLAAYEAEGGYFVHFSNFPKLGINPVNKFDTPTGFYAYPLDFAKINKFANERPYALIVRPVKARLWYLSTYDIAQYRADRAKLEDAFGNANGRLDVDEWLKGARVRTPAGQLWNVTRHLADKNTARWTRLLYSVLGYDGVVDDCEGIIHPNETCQAVFFDVRKLELVDVLRKGTTVGLKVPTRRQLSRLDLSRKNFNAEDLTGALFVRSNLRSASFVKSILRGATLTGADLRSANFTRADLGDAKLSRADLRDADFSHADLDGADLRGVLAYEADFTDATLRYAILKGVDLRGVDFYQTDFHFADMSKANLSSVYLGNSNLSRTILRGAILRGASMRGAKLQEADLRDADIRGADLRNAVVSGERGWGLQSDATRFSGAIYDDATQFPDGFDMARLA